MGDPFYNRITQQGIPSTNKTCLTIPAIKDALRRSGLIGRALMNNSNYDLGPLCGPTDADTLDRSRSALNQYFSVLRNANMVQWESGREGYLCTNVAVQAYILFLGSLIKYWEANTAADSREMLVEDILLELDEYMTPIREFLEHADENTISTRFKVPFGSGGPPEYYYRLCHIVKEKFPDFQPEGMQDWETEQSEENKNKADRNINELIMNIQKYIFKVFRSIHGESKDAYWDKGIPDKSIKAKAYERSLDYEVEERLPLETYLEVIEYKKIVEHRQNWNLFKAAFNIPEPGERGLAKNLKWMDRLNELRRIQAHPSEKRHYKVEDFEYIDYIYELFNRQSREAAENPIFESTGYKDSLGE